MTFRLTGHALDDMDSLLFTEAERSGWDRSMDLELQLWAEFEKLDHDPESVIFAAI